MIILRYLQKNQKEFEVLELSNENYFDLEKNEIADINSVPKYSQPYYYVNLPLEKLVFVELTIQLNEKKRTFKQTFWNNGENFLTERTDLDDNYKEIILTTKLESDRYEIMRLTLISGFLVPIYHGIITSSSNGKEKEDKFDTENFLEIIKSSR